MPVRVSKVRETTPLLGVAPITAHGSHRAGEQRDHPDRPRPRPQRRDNRSRQQRSDRDRAAHAQQLALINVVEEAIESAEPTAQAKGVRLEKILDPRGGIVSGDPARLQ